MKCKKCSKFFDSRYTVDGKVFTLYNRKYCLECSPFKQHNTKTLEGLAKERCCNTCGKIITRCAEKGNYCWVCVNKNNKKHKLASIKKLVGESCWICNYNKCWQALEFHHVYPETKLFQVTTRELQFSWERLEQEIHKCVLLCACCHREFHYGLIEKEKIIEIWKSHWSNCEISIIPKKEIKQHLCIDCNKEISYGCTRCTLCDKKSRRKVERPTKDELAILLWEKPATTLAKEYGVSDKSIEQWAKSYGLSKPPAGYWSKKK